MAEYDDEVGLKLKSSDVEENEFSSEKKRAGKDTCSRGTKTNFSRKGLPSLISLVVSVDVKHRVYLKGLKPAGKDTCLFQCRQTLSSR